MRKCERNDSGMNEVMVIDVAKDALMSVITIAAPLLLVALTVGFIVSIFQTVTSIQEPTLAFIPKILGVFITLIVLGPWMLNQLVELVNRLYTSFSTFIRS